MGKRETKTRGTVKSVKSENAAPNLTCFVRRRHSQDGSAVVGRRSL